MPVQESPCADDRSPVEDQAVGIERATAVRHLVKQGHLTQGGSQARIGVAVAVLSSGGEPDVRVEARETLSWKIGAGAVVRQNHGVHERKTAFCSS